MNNGNIFKKFLNDIKNHFFAFILSIVFSILFFYYIEDIQLSSGLVVNDIEFKNLDSNFIIKKVSTKKVSIYFKTTKENLSLIDRTILKPYIDLTNVKLGKNILKIKIKKDLLPVKTHIYKIEPKFITIFVDRKISKFLKIKPIIINKPQEGFVISQVYFTSDKVLVEGSKSILDNMEYIETSPINIDGVDKTILKEVSFNINNFNINNIKILSPKKVSIIIEVKKQYELHEFKNISVKIINKNEDLEYSLNTDKLSIKILIPPKTNNNATFNNLSFTIDGNNFKNEGEYTIIPVFNMPQQYEILQIIPDKISLTIRRKKIEIKKPSVNIQGILKTK